MTPLFQSQYSDDVPEVWRPRACSIANVRMVLVSRGDDVSTMADLIAEGESMNGFGPRGWVHDALVFLLHNHGVPAYREEFRSRDDAHAEVLMRVGVEKIRESVRAGHPVMVSLQKENGSYHTVLVYEVTDDGFVYHDPEVGPSQSVSEEVFLKQWKRLAIFTY